MTASTERNSLAGAQAVPEGLPPEEASVLMVCTGNICRSPAAQLLFGATLGTPHFTVASAGTMALVGEPVYPPIGDLLRGRSIDPGDFRARQLTEREVKAADLVLGMTRAHRGAAVSLWPAAVRRSFTLKEFARLAAKVPPAELAAAAGSGTPAARLAALTQLAGRHRAPARDTDDDVEDPYRRDQDVNERVFDEIERAVAAIVAITLGR